MHNDGTERPEDRLGALGDLELVIERAGLAGHDLLVLAGDNLFDFSLAEYVDFWRRKKDGSAIAVLECDISLVREYSAVETLSLIHIWISNRGPARAARTLRSWAERSAA